TLSEDGFVRVWNLAVDQRSPQQWEQLAEVVSGRGLRPSGGTVPLTADELATRWAEGRKNHPDDFRNSPGPGRTWHTLEARRCAEAEEWAAAAFHLTALVEAESEVVSHRLQRAEALGRLERFAEAEIELDQVLRAEPGNALARIRRGAVRRQQGKL